MLSNTNDYVYSENILNCPLRQTHLCNVSDRGRATNCYRRCIKYDVLFLPKNSRLKIKSECLNDYLISKC